MHAQQPSAQHPHENLPCVSATDAREALAQIRSLPTPVTKPATPLWAIISSAVAMGVAVAFVAVSTLIPFVITSIGLIILFGCIALANRRPGIRTAVRQSYDRREFQTRGERIIEFLIFGWIIFIMLVEDISDLLGNPLWFAILAGLLAAANLAAWLHVMNKQFDRARARWMNAHANTEAGRGTGKGRSLS